MTPSGIEPATFRLVALFKCTNNKAAQQTVLENIQPLVLIGIPAPDHPSLSLVAYYLRYSSRILRRQGQKKQTKTFILSTAQRESGPPHS
jgi:hypothetical protein